MKTKFLLSTLLSFSFYLLSSQVPQGFNYQAIARDNSYNPIINTPLPVEITIQSDSLGTIVLWKELHASITTNGIGLFSLILGRGVKQTGGLAKFSDINWSVSPVFIRTRIEYPGPGQWKDMGTSRLWSVPYSMGTDLSKLSKLKVRAQPSTDNDSVLFEVKNKTGQTVFAVYNEGVRIYVDDGVGKGITKGGFAIGSFGTDKAPSKHLLIVNTDSIRAYIDTTYVGKGITKGGFAIGGFGTEKGSKSKYLSVNANKTNIAVNDSIAGFSISNVQGGGSADFMKMNKVNYFLGHESGLKTVTVGDNGKFNSFIGYQAGHENIAGSRNIFVGFQAGYKNNAAGNVFIGNASGYNNVGGANNVFVGYSSGMNNSTGQYNTFLGYNSGANNIGGTSNVYVGYNTGDFNFGGYNVFMGSWAGHWTGFGSPGVACVNNVFIGFESGLNIRNGNGNVFIGYRAGKATGFLTSNDSLIIASSSSTTVYPLITGKFGTNASNGKIDIKGDLYVKGVLLSSSDLRLKTNLIPIDHSLQKLITLSGYYYFWNKNIGESGDMSDKRQIGLVAQEVEKVFPELVGRSGGYKAIDYIKVIPVMVQAIKEQNEIIIGQKTEIENIKNELAELRVIVSQLKNDKN